MRMAETINKIQALKEYFGTPEKPITFSEIKELGSDGVTELAELAAKELGKELTQS